METAALGDRRVVCYVGWMRTVRRLWPLWLFAGCVLGYLPVVVPLVLWWLFIGNAPRGEPGVVVRRSHEQPDLVGDSGFGTGNA